MLSLISYDIGFSPFCEQKRYELRGPSIYCFEKKNMFPSIKVEMLGMNSSTKQLAEHRIQVLFEQADTIRRIDPRMSKRYVEVARQIAMSAKVRLQAKYRRRICKKCNMILVQGSNCRVRLRPKREPHLVVTCLNCGNQTRYLLKKRNRASNF